MDKFYSFSSKIEIPQSLISNQVIEFNELSNGLLVFEIRLFARNCRLGHIYHIVFVPNDVFGRIMSTFTNEHWEKQSWCMCSIQISPVGWSGNISPSCNVECTIKCTCACATCIWSVGWGKFLQTFFIMYVLNHFITTRFLLSHSVLL